MPVNINFKAFKLDEFDIDKKLELINKVRDLEEEVIFKDFFKKWTLPVDVLFKNNSITHFLKHKVNSNVDLKANKPLFESVPIYFYCDYDAKELVSNFQAKNIVSNFEKKFKIILELNYPDNKIEMKQISSILTRSIIDYADRIKNLKEKDENLDTLREVLNYALEDWNIAFKTAYIHNYVPFITDYIENNNIMFSEHGDIIESKPYYEITNENKLGM